MYQKSSKAGSRSEISQWNSPEQTVEVSKLMGKMGNILITMRQPPLQQFVQVDGSSSGIKDNQTTTDSDLNVCGHLKKEVSC